MKLIADCGATKSHWAVVNGDCSWSLCETTGINALHISQDEILHIVTTQLLPHLSDTENISEVFFYGAGVVDEHIKMLIATGSTAGV